MHHALCCSVTNLISVKEIVVEAVLRRHFVSISPTNTIYSNCLAYLIYTKLMLTYGLLYFVQQRWDRMSKTKTNFCCTKYISPTVKSQCFNYYSALIIFLFCFYVFAKGLRCLHLMRTDSLRPIELVITISIAKVENFPNSFSTSALNYVVTMPFWRVSSARHSKGFSPHKSH